MEAVEQQQAVPYIAQNYSMLIARRLMGNGAVYDPVGLELCEYPGRGLVHQSTSNRHPFGCNLKVFDHGREAECRLSQIEKQSASTCLGECEKKL